MEGEGEGFHRFSGLLPASYTIWSASSRERGTEAIGAIHCNPIKIASSNFYSTIETYILKNLVFILFFNSTDHFHSAKAPR